NALTAAPFRWFDVGCWSCIASCSPLRIQHPNPRSDRRPPAADPPCPGRKALIMAHDQLRLYLVDRIHGHAYDDQQRCSTEVELHVQPVQQEPREIIIDE